MKTTNRTLKAIAVVFVIGLGILHNMDNNKMEVSPLRINSENWSETKEEAEKETESKLIIYTKAILKTSIQQLISNI